MRGRPTPLGALALGLGAGLAGTALMTAYQQAVSRLRGGGSGRPRRWRDAPAPAQMGKRVAELFEHKVTLDDVPLLTQATHWSYGTAWGAAFGLAEGTFRPRPLEHGVAFGTLLWGFSYASLVPAGVYEPPWRYPAKELALDLSYHLVYGLGVAGSYRALERAL